MKLKPTDSLQTNVAMLFEDDSPCMVSLATLATDNPIKNMVIWQEHHSGVGGKVHFSFMCILRKCHTLG